MKQYKSKDFKHSENESSSSMKHSKHRKRESVEVHNEKPTAQPVIQKVESAHCLVVVQRLLALLFGLDHSCSSDMFLLSCKVSY